MNISVIIPVFNAAPFVKEAVFSALKQTEVREVILVEDGSEDDSLSYCVELAAQETRVQLFRHPDHKNHGAGASRNLGMSYATQEYIAFLDADDYYLKNRFQQTKIAFRKHPDADGVYEAIVREFDDRVKDIYRNLYRDSTLISIQGIVTSEDLFETFFIAEKGWFHLNGLVIKRDLLLRSGFFDENLRQTQDTDFILRLCQVGNLRPASLYTPVSIARIHGNNRILNTEKSRYYRRLFFEKWFVQMLNSNWSLKLNRHITKGLLYNNPRVRKYEHNIMCRYLVKGGILFYLLIKHPALVQKLFL